MKIGCGHTDIPHSIPRAAVTPSRRHPEPTAVTTIIPPAEPQPAPAPALWQRAARSLRLLSILQIAAITLVAALTLGSGAIIGTRLLGLEAHRTHAITMQREVASIGSDMHGVAREVWLDRTEAPEVAARDWLLRTAEARRSMTRLAELERTHPNAVIARAASRVRDELRGIVAWGPATVAPAGTRDDAGAFAATTRARASGLALRVEAWVTSYSREIEGLQAKSERLTRLVVVLLAAVSGVACLVAAWVWIALNRARARLVRSMEMAVEEQTALRRTATLAAGHHEPADVFRSAVHEIRDLMGFGQAALVRYVGPVTGRVLAASSGDNPVHVVVPLVGANAVAQVHATGRAAMVEDTQAISDAYMQPTAAETNVRAAICAPITLDGAPWGAVLHYHSVPFCHTDEHLRRLERFSELIGLAVASAERFARLSDQATKDPLTGLANHRAFRERLADEAERARRHGREMALAVFDIDQFKLVNEALGHQGGDRALVDLAQRLVAASREGDLVARVGGEEFAWLMPETDSWGAWCAAERVRVEVSRTPLDGLDALTVSAGVCDLAQADWQGERLHELADGAVYWAKAHGRDLCVRYSPDVVVDLSAHERAARLEQRRTLDAVRLLAQAVDARDPNTQRHSERVAQLACELAAVLGWSGERIAMLREAALVHDVGKIGVPDSVLLKEGPLTADEFARIKTHAALGAQMVSDVLVPEQVTWVRNHHERWDGNGYPDGIAGEHIPDGAQVLIVADAFDAMTADRPYRRGLVLDAAYEQVIRGCGSQFPPAVVEAMTTVFVSGRLPSILQSAATSDDDGTTDRAS